MERAVSVALTSSLGGPLVPPPLLRSLLTLLFYLALALTPFSYLSTALCPSVFVSLSLSLFLFTPLCVCGLAFVLGLCFGLPVAACPQRFQFDKHPGGVQKRPFVKRLLPQLLQLLLLLCNVSSSSPSPTTTWAIS